MRTEITTIGELANYLPKIVQLYRDMDGKWFRFRDEAEFVSKLVEQVKPANKLYIELDDTGMIKYFLVTFIENRDEAYWWLLYCNPLFRSETKLTVKQVLNELRDEGIKRVFFSSTRLTSAYRRWVEKSFGATMYSQAYKIEL